MKRTQNSLLFLTLSILFFYLSTTTTKSMADPSSEPSSEAKVHIVYTEQPQEGVDPESFHVQTLASVLGSEESAKGALIYSYKHAASGFSAKLTPQQVEELSKKPCVLQVVESQTYQLHSTTGGRGPMKMMNM